MQDQQHTPCFSLSSLFLRGLAIGHEKVSFHIQGRAHDSPSSTGRGTEVRLSRPKFNRLAKLKMGARCSTECTDLLRLE